MSTHLHIVCIACDAVNRSPTGHDLRSSRCSSCRHALFDGRPAELDEDRFWRHLERSDLPIAASFCDGGSIEGDDFAATAERVEPEARFVTIAADRLPHIALRFGIDRLPARALFRNGRLVSRKMGQASAAELTEWIATSLD